MEKLLLILLIIFFGCRAENKEKEIEHNTPARKFQGDSVRSKKPNLLSNYEVIHVNDGYGKRLYIDSLNFEIVKRYFYKDSTKLWFVDYSDIMNDTVYRKGFYFNGNTKYIKRLSYRKFIRIGEWKFFDKNGKLRKAVDYSTRFSVSFYEAGEIARQRGIPRPFGTSISKDSLHWIIMNWSEGEYDSITGISTGFGLKIDRNTGSSEKIKRTRSVEIN